MFSLSQGNLKAINNFSNGQRLYVNSGPASISLVLRLVLNDSQG